MDVHIRARPDGWAVKLSGNSRASAIYGSKKRAKKKGRKKAKKMARRKSGKINLIVHKKNGSVQETRTYGRAM